MNITVPAGAQDPARPPASQDGLEALLRVLPHRYKPGLRALLTGPEPSPFLDDLPARYVSRETAAPRRPRAEGVQLSLF